jgi:hypothetical protein
MKPIVKVRPRIKLRAIRIGRMRKASGDTFQALPGPAADPRIAV